MKDMLLKNVRIVKNYLKIIVQKVFRTVAKLGAKKRTNFKAKF